VTTATLTPPDWTEQAACAQTGVPDAWFPEVGEPLASTAVVRICQTCPVRDTCLQVALDNHETHGVWGGLTPNQRHLIRHRRPAAACGTEAGHSRHRRRGETPCEPCVEAMREASRRRHSKNRNT
jgi:hypothetical protein